MIKHVKADSLGSVFTDSTLSVFTDYARNNGVTTNSIIFITCDDTDADAFGLEFKEGSKWIWTKEGLYANATYPISNSEIDDIFEDEFEGVESGGIGGGSSTVDLSNYYTKDETDTKFATVETVNSKAETSQVENLNSTFTSALAGKANTSDVQALQTTVSEVLTELNTKVPVTTVNALLTATEAAQAGVDAIGYEEGVVSREDSKGWGNDCTVYMDASYTKVGDICSVAITAELQGGWWDVYFSLPVTPIKNSDGVCMNSAGEDIHYTTIINHNNYGIPVVKIERQYRNAGFAAGSTVSFVLTYKYK